MGDDPRRDDQLSDRAPNRGRGTKLIHTRSSPLRVGADLAIAYRWPLLLGVAGIVLGLWAGPLAWAIGQIPDLAWSSVFYGTITFTIGLPFAYLVWRRVSTVNGVEVLDLDPVSGSHRHVRIGYDQWADLTVLTPWGDETDTHALNRCSINGRSGYEVMDLRVPEGSDSPVCVATWMGEADSAALRTYRSAVRTAHRRLARRAQRNLDVETNADQIKREAAEEAVMWQIRQSNDTGVPTKRTIEEIVDDVVGDMDGLDPLAPDDLDPERSDDRARDRQPEETTERPPEPRDPLLNDGGPEP